MVRKTVYMTVLSLLFVVCMFLATGITVLADTTDGTTDEDGLITITFDYGRNEEYLKSINYKFGDNTYSTSIEVRSGITPSEIMELENHPILPAKGTEINKSNFDNWTFINEYGYEDYISGFEYDSYTQFNEDITLTASWNNTVTYHATSSGHFYGGETECTEQYSGRDTILDVSFCCYPNSNDKAFIGWSLDGTPEKMVDDTLVVAQNFNLYAVYVDGYPVTFNVNIEGGALLSYYESNMNSDGWRNYGKLRSLDSGTKALTLTYPKDKKPYEAPYFCYNPFRYQESQIDNGDAKVKFSNWSVDTSGGSYMDFNNMIPAGDGSDTLYAIWKDYYVVTFDANREEYNYTTTQNVIKGSSLSSIPYNSFGYTDTSGDVNVSKRCYAFNTKKDGSGAEIDYSFTPTEDVTVYAQYKNIYRVYLDGNGGYIDDYYTTFEVDQGDEFKIGDKWLVTWPAAEDGAVSRKVFSYWNTKEDGSGITAGTSDAAPFKPESDVTLYAIPEDGALVTFDTNAQEGDEGNEYGTIFNFRRSGNVTKATFAYSKKRPMESVPYPSYVNDDSKQFAGWSTVYGDTSKIINQSTFIPKEDITLYAVWYDMVPVKYHANGGSYGHYGDNDVNPISVIKGKKFNVYDSEIPSISNGLAFAGWAEREGSSNVIANGTAYIANGPLDFYAVWEKGNIITLDGNGGSVYYHVGGHGHSGESDNAVFTIKKGSTVIATDGMYGMERPSGYHEDNLILVGFSKTKNGEIVDLTTYVPEQDETFYAIWEEPVKVTFNPTEGNLPEGCNNTEYAAKGESVYSTPTPTAEGKKFVGWFTDLGTDKEKRFNNNTPVNTDITVYAKWTTETVVLTFDAGENALVRYWDDYGNPKQVYTIEVAKESEVNLMNINWETDSSDVRFTGWKTGEYTWNVKDNNSYYVADSSVKFTAIVKDVEYYNITFNGNGGLVEYALGESSSEETIDIGIEKGNSIGNYILVNRKIEDGYGFTGWYKEKECVNLVATGEKIAYYVPTEDMVLYAGWEQKKIPVTGIDLNKKTVTLGVSGEAADSFDLSAIVYPTNATNDKVQFTSSAEQIATVSATGKITAVKEGTATITAATVDGGFIAECIVTVVSKTVDEVNKDIETLSNAIDSASDQNEAKEILDETLEELGGAERLKDIVSDNAETAEKLSKLESAYVGKANVTVEDPAKDMENVTAVKEVLGVSEDEAKTMDVSGAGLNAEPGQTIGLSVKPADNEAEIDKKYTNAKQLDIELTAKTGEGAEETVKDLTAPVTIVMPIPSGVIRSKLYILHFNEDGTCELIRPVFKNNTMIFTVSHFSLFAFVELADSEVVDPEGGSGNEGNGNGNGNENGNNGENGSGNNGENGNGNNSSNGDGNNGGNGNGGNNSSGSNGENGNSNDGNNNSGSSTGTAATPVKDGETVTETGSTVKYEVSSAKDKTVAYAGDTSAAGKVTVKSTIKVGSDTYTVTSIANGAFKKSKITAVTIPDTVVSIGKSAFEGDTKLKSVTIKGTKLATIGDNAFKGCSALTKITLPKNVKSVGKQAFANCKKLKTITVKSKKTKFLKNSLKSVPKSAKLKLPKMTAKEKKAFKKMLKSAGFKGKIK